MATRFLCCLFAGLFLTRPAHADCVQVVNASQGGHYASNGQPLAHFSYHVVGYHQAYGELRNWFVFNLPAFSGPLVRAELRLLAGNVAIPGASETLELHPVSTPISNLVSYAGNVANTFTDLGDGSVLGSRQIAAEEGGRSGGIGAMLGIPLNAMGLAALTSRQGSSFALGGAVSTLEYSSAPEILFAGGFVSEGRPDNPHLVLFFEDSGAPKTTVLLGMTGGQLAGDRLNLEGVACGAEPLSRQWLKDGAAIPHATNEILELRVTSVADTGIYQLSGSNHLGVVGVDVPVFIEPLRISVPPTSTSAAENAEAFFYVNVLSWYPVSYQWRKDGTNLIGRTTSQLYFQHVTFADAGSYDVIVSNPSGSITSVTATLTVQLRPPVIQGYSTLSQQGALGRPFEIWFSVSGSQPLTYLWYKDGQLLPGLNTNVFSVAAAQYSHSGDYQIVVTNQAGRATSAVVRLTIEPLLVFGPYYSYPLWLNPLTLSASLESLQPRWMQWFFNGAPISNATNLSYKIPAFDYPHEGEYFLIASNLYGAATSSVVAITVVTQAPTVYIYDARPTAWVGDYVIFRGSVAGGPPPLMQWLFNGVPLAGETNVDLVFPHLTTNQTGTYTLTASNVFGSTNFSANLEVRSEAPFFIAGPANSNEVSGSILTLRAQALGGPPPAYQWRRSGVDLPRQTNSSLTIQNLQISHSGEYEIVARNEHGEASYRHRLTVNPATGLDRMQWRAPRPQGSRMRSIAHGSGRFVAVGKTGIISSGNGIAWDDVIIEADCDLGDVAYGNGIFVASGLLNNAMLITNWTYHPYATPDSSFGLILVSSNGVEWTTGVNPEREILRGIAYGNGVFVAGSHYQAFNYISTDGRHWTAIRSPQSLRVADVLFAGGQFIATDGVRLFHSPNGIDWAQSELPDLAYSIFGLAYKEGQYVALQYGGLVLLSTDGHTWMQHDTSLFYANGLTAGPQGFVAALQTPVGRVAVSSDAINWTEVNTGTVQELEAITYAAGQFVAVGEAGTITRSVDGSEWTPDQVANRIDYYGLTHAGELVVAAGDAGTILTTTNGLAWTHQLTPTTRNLHGVGHADGLFVAVGRRGTIITSPDGSAWTVRDSGVPEYLQRVARGNGLWVAVGELGVMSVSSNGLNWIGMNTGFPSTDHEGVAFGNGRWVAAGGYFSPNARSTIYSSVDGHTWTLQPGSIGVRYRDVGFAQGRFVAVANDANVSVSTNGLSWTTYRIPYPLASDNFRRIHYAGGRWLLVGNDGALLSAVDPSNPSSWARHRSRTTQNLHDIHAAGDGTVYTAGNNGMILQSGNIMPKFLQIHRGNGSVRLDIDPGIAAGVLRLESSIDLDTWDTAIDSITGSVEVPAVIPKTFWRLVVP